MDMMYIQYFVVIFDNKHNHMNAIATGPAVVDWHQGI